MSNLFLILMIAFVLIVIAIAGLAIGWLITGKTKIHRGCCGNGEENAEKGMNNPSSSITERNTLHKGMDIDDIREKVKKEKF